MERAGELIVLCSSLQNILSALQAQMQFYAYNHVQGEPFNLSVLRVVAYLIHTRLINQSIY